MRSPSAVERRSGVVDDRGSATAELAVALPAVAIVLAVCVWGVHLAAVQVRLQDAAGFAARSAARADDLAESSAIMPQAELTISRDGELVCATASVEARTPVSGVTVALTAVSCAIAEPE